jgi:hypothetical protein
MVIFPTGRRGINARELYAEALEHPSAPKREPDLAKRSNFQTAMTSKTRRWASANPESRHAVTLGAAFLYQQSKPIKSP